MSDEMTPRELPLAWTSEMQRPRCPECDATVAIVIDPGKGPATARVACVVFNGRSCGWAGVTVPVGPGGMDLDGIEAYVRGYLHAIRASSATRSIRAPPRPR